MRRSVRLISTLLCFVVLSFGFFALASSNRARAANQCVAIAGDSVEHGMITFDNSSVDGKYPPLFSGQTVASLVTGGQDYSVPAAKVNSYVGSSTYRSFLSSGCQYFVVGPWVNDLGNTSASITMAGIQQMVSDIKNNNSSAQIFLVNYYTPPNIAGYANLIWPNLKNSPEADFNGRIQSLVGSNISLIDVSSFGASDLERKCEVGANPDPHYPQGCIGKDSDGVHLSASGRSALAAAINQAVRRSSSSGTNSPTSSGSSSSPASADSPTISASSPDTGTNGDKVGPELAFFDSMSQRGVCDKVINANGFLGTVAVMNDVAVNPYNPCPGPAVTLRLVLITHATTASQMEAFADKLKNSSEFATSNNTAVRVIVGVELNNLDPEFYNAPDMDETTAGREYAGLFNAFAAKMKGSPYKIYPAPPDLYQGNPKYNADPWIQGFLSAVDCSGIGGLTGDIFAVPDDSGINTYKEYEAKIKAVCGGAPSVDYFEGWGINPNNKPSIRSQVEWYKKTKLPDGIERAATLVKNTCEDNPPVEKRWFFYVKGKVYDRDGTEIDPDTCGGSRKKYYLYPGIEEETNFPEQLKKASEYMLTCAPRLSFIGKIENEDKINTPSPGFTPIPLDCSKPGSCTIPEVTGFAYVNHEQTTIPLYRFQNASIPNATTPQRRLDDWEGFFSAKYTGGTDQYTNFVANGTATNLSTSQATCQATLDYLQVIKNLCDHEAPATVAVNNPKLLSPTSTLPQGTSPTKCALDLTLPNSPDSYLDVLKSRPEGFSCTGDTTSLSADVAKRFQDYKDKLVFIETTTPKAFKPAYIVHYVDHPSVDPTILDKFENWLSPQGSSRQEKLGNRVKVTKVYVPAGFATSATDTPTLIDKSVKTSFNGGFMTTMYSLTPAETTQQIQQKMKEQTDDIFSRSSGSNMSNPDPFSDKFLSCPECEDESFVSVLVRRINAEVVRARDADEENLDCLATDIAGEKATEKKQMINPDGTLDPVREISMPARATLKAKGSIGKKISLRTYLLLPQEYKNVLMYEKVLASALFPPNFPESLAFSLKGLPDDSGGGKPAYKYLQLSDTAPKFGRSGKTVHMSSDPKDGQIIGYQTGPPPLTPTTEAPGGAAPKPKAKGSAVTLKGTIASDDTSTFDVNPLTPGGRLARGLWELVCHAIQPPTNAEYAPYQGFEKILQQGSAACFRETASACQLSTEQPTLTQIGNGWLVSAPANSANLITSLPNEYGQKTCDWAKGKGLAFAVNANFGENATTPIGPFGFNGNITDAPAGTNRDTMSLVIEKSGEAHIYDWYGRTSKYLDPKHMDKSGKPDLINTNFIVTGVFYNNFRPPYDGVMYRTAVGIKDNKLFIRNLAATPEGVRQVMNDALGIDEGHFIMLDGDSVSQLCKSNPDGSMTQVFPDPTDPERLKDKYPFAVSVSLGIRAGGSSGADCSNVAESGTQPGNNSGSAIACPAPKNILIAGPNLECNVNAPSPPATWASLKIGTHHLVNGIVSIADPRSSGNQIDRCFNDVVNQSLAAGINPIFTLTIWGQESGASNHLRFPGTEDFGIHNERNPVVGFQAQLSSFLNLAYSYPKATCFKNICSVENFSQMFKYGQFDSSCTMKAAPYAAKTVRNMRTVAPNCDLPVYPTQMTSCR